MKPRTVHMGWVSVLALFRGAEDFSVYKFRQVFMQGGPLHGYSLDYNLEAAIKKATQDERREQHDERR